MPVPAQNAKVNAYLTPLLGGHIFNKLFILSPLYKHYNTLQKGQNNQPQGHYTANNGADHDGQGHGFRAICEKISQNKETNQTFRAILAKILVEN